METVNNYLQELIAFHYVAKHSSFTKAASLLGLSKSQLSRQIKSLEFYVNAQLFHRTTRSVALTEEGRGLFISSEGLVKLSQETANNMRELLSGKGGVIRLTCPGSLGEWLAVPLIEQFKQNYPEIAIEFDLNNQRRSLIEENYDFALRAMEENAPNLICHYLGRVRDVICATPKYLQEHPFEGRPEELQRHNCIVTSLKSETFWSMEEAGGKHKIRAQGKYASNNYITSRIMCLGDLGVAKLPFYQVKQDLEEGKLVNLLPQYDVSTHPLYLVHPMRSQKPLKYALFREILIAWFAQQDFIFLREKRSKAEG